MDTNGILASVQLAAPAPARVTTRRRADPAVTRERLLEAGASVMRERKAVDASLEEIAARAGLTKGAIYSNFAGKDEFLYAVYARIAREALAGPAGRPDLEAQFAGDLESRIDGYRRLLVAVADGA